MSSIIELNKIFTGMDPSDEITIFYVVLLQKIIKELQNTREYSGHIIENIANILNATISKNIDMIEQETRAIEIHFLTQNNSSFKIHPLEYMHKLSTMGEKHLEKFRELIYKCCIENVSDISIQYHITTWLLSANIENYKHAVNRVYSSQLK